MRPRVSIPTKETFASGNTIKRGAGGVGNFTWPQDAATSNIRAILEAYVVLLVNLHGSQNTENKHSVKLS